MSDEIPLKRSAFLFVSAVHTLALAEMIERPGKLQAAEIHAMVGLAAALVDRVPEGRSPTQAAAELLYEYLSIHKDDNFYDDEFPRPDWLPERTDWDPDSAEAGEKIDGKWQPENPRWRNLPSDKSSELNIMAELIERPRRTVSDLAGAVGASVSSVEATLADLSSYVVSDRSRPALWSPSAALLKTAGRPAEPSSRAVAMPAPGKKKKQESSSEPVAHKGAVKAGKRPAHLSANGSTNMAFGAKPAPQAASATPSRLATAKPSHRKAKSLATRKPRRQLPKGLGRPLNVHIVNGIASSLRDQPAQRYFVIAAGLNVLDDVIRRYLDDLEALGVVAQIAKNPKRWSLTAGWAEALEKALASVVTDTSEPKRLVRTGRLAIG